MATQVQALQKQVSQLRMEANVPRIPVSQAVEELVTYTNQRQATDVLVIGINQSENPFRDTKSCSIL